MCYKVFYDLKRSVATAWETMKSLIDSSMIDIAWQAIEALHMKNLLRVDLRYEFKGRVGRTFFRGDQNSLASVKDGLYPFNGSSCVCFKESVYSVLICCFCCDCDESLRN